MKLDSAALDAYDARTEQLVALGPVAEGLVRELVRASAIAPHSVTHRVKTKKSFRRKLSEKGETYSSIDDVHDLLGVRVITYFPDEVDEVARIIEREFDVKPEHSVDKRAILAPDRFGYLSLHYVCGVSEARSSLTEHKRFAGLLFEVQIRSILQHSWAEIEHDLGYHTEGAVPRGVRRRFSRLAGLLELADAEFQGIRDELGEYKESLAADPVSDAGIDRDSVLAFVMSDPLAVRLDLSIGHRHADGIEDLTEHRASQLAQQLQQVEMSTMAELRDALQTRATVIERFVEEWFKGRGPLEGPVPRGIALFYLWYVLAAERLNDNELVEAIRARNFGDGTPQAIADDVRTAYASATAD